MHIKNGRKKMIKSIKRVYIKNKIKKIEKRDLYKLNPCLNLVNNLNKQYNQENMQSCYHNILKISKLFPPAKNENKFIYGKLIELELINTFNKFSLCTELDKYHDTGSEYKNDCLINKNKFSIKASKNGGEIIIINKLNKSNHDIDINFIICHISKRKLYIFPSLIILPELIVDKDSNIHFKSSIFNYIEKNFNKFIYNFPEISNKESNDVEEVQIYEYLYNTFIKKKNII